jgi:hypothetical protein
MQHKYIYLFSLPLIFILIFGMNTVPSSAQNEAVIDFEGLPAGMIVDTVSAGNGISGEPIEGYVQVLGVREDLGPSVNTAMIFDATCPPGNIPADCTGGDADLFYPDLGKILIICEGTPCDPSDPNDANLFYSNYLFFFGNWGSGTVTVNSLEAMDVEEDQDEGDALMQFFSGGLEGTLLGTVDIPDTGNNGRVELPVGLSGVDTMLVTLNGSGAIDNISITPDQPTAVEMVDFRVASVLGQRVEITWTTAAEIDNIGFNLYRAASPTLDQAELVAFLPAQTGPGDHTYIYVDHVPQSGSWWYWVADQNTAGAESFHGPIAAETVAFTDSIYLPVLLDE